MPRISLTRSHLGSPSGGLVLRTKTGTSGLISFLKISLPGGACFVDVLEARQTCLFVTSSSGESAGIPCQSSGGGRVVGLCFRG